MKMTSLYLSVRTGAGAKVLALADCTEVMLAGGRGVVTYDSDDIYAARRVKWIVGEVATIFHVDSASHRAACDDWL